MTIEYTSTDARLTLHRPTTRWLSTGFDGGYRRADAAHNLTVPEGFDRTDLEAYAAERLGDAPDGPTLLTGVSQRHARGARRGPVTAVATAGLSNPAALPMDPSPDAPPAESPTDWRPGTVNVFVTSADPLDDGGLAGLLTTAVEARAATILDAAGVPGTTSDAVVVGSDSGSGDGAAFAGSATPVGVREAVAASLASRYVDDAPPAFGDARYGVATDAAAEVFEP